MELNIIKENNNYKSSSIEIMINFWKYQISGLKKSFESFLNRIGDNYKDVYYLKKKQMFKLSCYNTAWLTENKSVFVKFSICIITLRDTIS